MERFAKLRLSLMQIKESILGQEQSLFAKLQTASTVKMTTPFVSPAALFHRPISRELHVYLKLVSFQEKVPIPVFKWSVVQIRTVWIARTASALVSAAMFPTCG